jgi:bifunctional non-homologous end joining protein LigD
MPPNFAYMPSLNTVLPPLWLRMLWRVSRPIRSRSKPPGFILPCQPALAERPPSGPGWLHEIKFDGYRVIARKDGERVRLWARTTSDYSNTFTRIRDAVAALPVDSAVLDGEAIVLRPDNTSDFEALRSRRGGSGLRGVHRSLDYLVGRQ